jgi:hypothetical protein
MSRTSSGDSDFKELIKPKITEDSQVLAALASTGAGFEALGGSSLMLTEPVENGVDSIISAGKSGIVSKGIIRVFIDQTSEQVVIVDNGLGFIDPRHICERPFDSLKKYDPDLTGKFARGLQGFRSYCRSLKFVTRRLTIPSGEAFAGKSGNTLELQFRAEITEVSAGVIRDEEFERWSWNDFRHGAVAFYRDWKAGEFQKIRKEKLIRRIERHFGELIRKGKIEILVWEGKGLVPGKKISRNSSYECKPRDYSDFRKIDLDSVPYIENGLKRGEVVYQLYLSSRARSDRDYLPFLMYKDRPVGDAPIALIAEFGETDVWNSSYLTGFIRADFCEINELRLALKPGLARDFLYQQLEGSENFLREEIKKHHRGLIDIRRSQEINQLVNRLQTFLKEKKIFDFKLAKEFGQISTGEEPETLKLTTGFGEDDSLRALSSSGESVISGKPLQVREQYPIAEGQEPRLDKHQDDLGGRGEGGSQKSEGGPGGPGAIGKEGELGHREQEEGLDKMKPIEEKARPGDPSTETRKTVKRRRPRGFNISTFPDEFTDELSSFDPVNSTVIVNSAHERFKQRDNPEDPASKELLDYMSELYIWEICKMAGQMNPDMNIADIFLKTKFEFFEKAQS